MLMNRCVILYKTQNHRGLSMTDFYNHFLSPSLSYIIDVNIQNGIVEIVQSQMVSVGSVSSSSISENSYDIFHAILDIFLKNDT